MHLESDLLEIKALTNKKGVDALTMMQDRKVLGKVGLTFA